MQTLFQYTELLLSGYQIWSADGQRVILVNEQTGDVETLIFPILS